MEVYTVSKYSGGYNGAFELVWAGIDFEEAVKEIKLCSDDAKLEKWNNGKRIETWTDEEVWHIR